MKLLFAFLLLGLLGASLAREFVPITDEQWAKLKLQVPTDENGNALHFCPTDQLSAWKKEIFGTVSKASVNAAGCQGEGRCDDPDYRDKFHPFPMTINIIVNVVCEKEGVCPSGVGQDQVDGQLRQLTDDFRDANIRFNLKATNFVVNSQLSTISAYGLTNKWYNEIRQVKSLYAVDPKNNINVFITGQKQGMFGTLLGIGTFPWDPEALTEYGGLWLNAAFTGYGHKTLGHEFGHNIGLWHVFHGVSEVKECSACYENPHPEGQPAANLVGDFAADTPATPTNYYCEDPSSTDPCDNVKWTRYGGTGIFNIMNYTPDTCMRELSRDQSFRAHCWVCNAIPSVLTADSQSLC